MGTWRYLADDGVSASFGLAADDFMARRQEGLPVIRLYTYRSHCALVGRFQRLDAELHREACRREGVEMNRRPTGGGAILMGADQLGVAITVPARLRPTPSSGVRELFHRYSRGLIVGLGSLGIAAAFHRKNDLEVDRRKIAGLGFYFDRSGGLLFHASLLLDLDVELMLRVLKTPFEKISDKEITAVSHRITTVRRESGRAVTVAEARSRILAGYHEALGVDPVADAFTPAELAGIAALEQSRYRRQDWIDHQAGVAETFGFSRVKTPGGLIEVHLTLSGEVTKAVYLTGDFFADERGVAEVERRLKRVRTTAPAIEAALQGLVGDEPWPLPGVPMHRLARAVMLAAEAASGKAGTGTGQSHGCFVTPGATSPGAVNAQGSGAGRETG